MPTEPLALKNLSALQSDRERFVFVTNGKLLYPDSSIDYICGEYFVLGKKMGRRQKFDGARLKQLRKKTPFTQETLALRIGISRETVSAIENNKTETINNIGIETIVKWKVLCESFIDDSEKKSFRDYVLNYLGL